MQEAFGQDMATAIDFFSTLQLVCLARGTAPPSFRARVEAMVNYGFNVGEPVLGGHPRVGYPGLCCCAGAGPGSVWPAPWRRGSRPGPPRMTRLRPTSTVRIGSTSTPIIGKVGGVEGCDRCTGRRSLMRPLGTGSGTRPAAESPSVLFPWGGQAVLKGGYITSDTWAWFEVGPYGSSG